MNIEAFRNYCLAKPGVTEEFPFDTQTVVYKVKGKIFSLANVDRFESMNVKCAPEKALQLREYYPGVLPGYHMNKKHWNTINNDGTISDELLYQWIDDSYQLVRATLSRTQHMQLQH